PYGHRIGLWLRLASHFGSSFRELFKASPAEWRRRGAIRLRFHSLRRMHKPRTGNRQLPCMGLFSTFCLYGVRQLHPPHPPPPPPPPHPLPPSPPLLLIVFEAA